MRIRSIRPEFWSSEDVAQMDWHTRLVYIGLWSYVDDNGVGRDVERLITAALFPLDEDLSECSLRVHGALKHLKTGGQITRYKVDRKPYLHVTAWETHQRINRPSADRYPIPTSGNAKPARAFSEPSVSPHDTLSAGEGEKGRRGEGEKGKELARVDPVLFDEFWNAYGKKVGRGKAEAAFAKALKAATGLDLIRAAAEHAEWHARAGTESRFIPHATTWLNEKRWMDERPEPAAPRGTNKAADRMQTNLSVVEELRRREAQQADPTRLAIGDNT